MINNKQIKTIYMCGIGGTSMSGIAKILRQWGFSVSGSDSNKSSQTDWLEENGIKVNIGQIEENISDDIDLFVYSAAIKETNPEYEACKRKNIPMMERGEFLGELTKLFNNTIGVSGTHGKTSTTSMLAYAFIEADLDPTIQVGSNLDLLEGNYRVGKSDLFIIEACEYADSFLNFKEKSAILLNIDNDHMDYFGTIENAQKSYEKYVSLLPRDGFLIINNDDNRCLEVSKCTNANVVTVGEYNNSEWFYNNVFYDENGYPTFDVYHNSKFVGTITLSVVGEYNIKNALAALALAYEYGISFDTFKNAIVKFTGASRRLEYKGKINGAKVYDDYGHHPTEIKAVASGIKNKNYRESWVIFEPHTFSRLADHLDQFAEALINFDNIIITDIYAAREINTFNINSDDLVTKINLLGHEAIYISNHEDIIKYIQSNVKENDIIITLGAGIVTKIADKIVEVNFKEKKLY